MSSQLKRSDWVACKSTPQIIGTVKRLARDGSWADVNWGWHTKRMQTEFLEVHTTLDLGDGWTVTDMDRERELSEGGRVKL